MATRLSSVSANDNAQSPESQIPRAFRAEKLFDEAVSENTACGLSAVNCQPFEQISQEPVQLCSGLKWSEQRECRARRYGVCNLWEVGTQALARWVLIRGKGRIGKGCGIDWALSPQSSCCLGWEQFRGRDLEAGQLREGWVGRKGGQQKQQRQRQGQKRCGRNQRKVIPLVCDLQAWRYTSMQPM